MYFKNLCNNSFIQAVYVMFYPAIITPVMMPCDDLGEIEHP
jgi:hypothetical protein